MPDLDLNFFSSLWWVWKPSISSNTIFQASFGLDLK
jgi:hypothetical protein